MKGELRFAVKSGFKQEIVGSAFFKLLSSFHTSRGGGSEAPIRRLARWGLLLKLHGTSLEENKTSILVYVFTITFAWFVRAVAHLTVLETGLKIQRFK